MGTTGLQESPDRAALKGFASIAGELTTAQREGRDLDDVLNLIAAQIGALLDVPRVSLYLRDLETGIFRGQVGFGADDRLIKRLTGGVEADRFTREVARTKRPVIIANAMTDPRTISSTMREWGVRSVIGVPMVVNEEVIGLLFADAKEERRAFDTRDEEVASGFATLAAIAVQQARLTSELQGAKGSLAKQNRILKTAAAVDEKLTRLVIDGCEVDEIVATVSNLVAAPCVVFDADMERVAASSAEAAAALTPERFRECIDSDPELARSIRDPSRRAELIGPFSRQGVRERLLLAPVNAGGERLGTLVEVETRRRISDVDVLALRRAANVVAVEMVARRRVSAAEWDARSSLAAHLIHGTADAASRDRQAAFLGVDLTLPRVVCLFSLLGTTASFDGRKVASRLEADSPGLECFATSVTEGVALCLQLPDAPSPPAAYARAKELVGAACAELIEMGPIAASISSMCSSPGDYPAAYAAAQEVLRCVVRFCPPRTRASVLSAAEVGAARQFLASIDSEAATGYVAATFGRLENGRRSGEQLMLTLQVFFEGCASIKSAARALDVHDNTIRYRLARIEDLTGYAFDDADDVLRIHLALKILELKKLAEEDPAAAAGALSAAT
jgi:sugar diacid utilization regulator/GAF domain-containing protein